MSVVATEELFDNLMKDVSVYNSEDSREVDSDEDNEACVRKRKENKKIVNEDSSGYSCTLGSVSEEISGTGLINDESNGLDTSNVDLTAAVDCSVEDANLYPVSIMSGVAEDGNGEVFDNNSACVEIIENVDSSHVLGVELDPSATQDYESVETITVDANQKTQDEDEGGASNGPSEVPLSLEVTGLESMGESKTCPISEATQNSDQPVIANIENGNVSSQSSDPEPSEAAPSKSLTGSEYLKQFKIFSNLTGESEEEKSKPSAEKDPLEALGNSLNIISYVCEGCKSKFWIERFYLQHKTRVTTQILYDCKHCKKGMVFSNPCSLKIHLMLHGDQTNLDHLQESNLKVKLPSLNEFQEKFFFEVNYQKVMAESSSNVIELVKEKAYKCSECCEFVPSLLLHLLYRADSPEKYSCNQCNYTFSSKCAFDMHLRFHQSRKPYSCPECGTSFLTRNRLRYHLALECFHFSRCAFFRCKCGVLKPERKDLKHHILVEHRTSLFKCLKCQFYFKNAEALAYHCTSVHSEWSGVKPENHYFKCGLCFHGRKLFPLDCQELHMKCHVYNRLCKVFGFKCGCCERLFYNPVLFMNHMQQGKCIYDLHMKFMSENPAMPVPKPKRKCPEYKDAEILKKIKLHFSENEEFKFKIPSKEVSIVPSIGMFKPVRASVQAPAPSTHMACPLCDMYFLKNKIRNHILVYHKCKDFRKYVQLLEEVVSVDDVEGSEPSADGETPKPVTASDKAGKKTKGLNCPNCEYTAASKEDFQSHIVQHREDGAYQCLECGECFVCRKPLEIHLVSVHSIKDTSRYVSTHYVHNSLPKPGKKALQPNQCSVCFDVFPDEKSLRLHFRSHGMAFLRLNLANKLSSK